MRAQSCAASRCHVCCTWHHLYSVVLTTTTPTVGQHMLCASHSLPATLRPNHPQALTASSALTVAMHTSPQVSDCVLCCRVVDDDARVTGGALLTSSPPSGTSCGCRCCQPTTQGLRCTGDTPGGCRYEVECFPLPGENVCACVLAALKWTQQSALQR